MGQPGVGAGAVSGPTPRPTREQVEAAEKYAHQLAASWAKHGGGLKLAHLLAEYDRRGAELERVQQVIREYVWAVEDGTRFDALVSVVPGLESDDGVYPTGELERLRAVQTAARALLTVDDGDDLGPELEALSAALDGAS